jgi:glycosyltransferase involved in cell wall biosynthesis
MRFLKISHGGLAIIKVTLKNIFPNIIEMAIIMNTLVIHPSVNICGGAEQVCLSVIEALKESGNTVTLATFDKPNWKAIELNFGKVTKPDFEIVKKRMFDLSAYGELLNFHFLSSTLSQDFDAAIVSCTSPWYYCPKSKKTIIYMLPPVEFQDGLKRAYLYPYNMIQNQLLNRVRNKIIVTNSIYSLNVIKKVYSLSSQIIYPPVKVKSYFSNKKEPLVVSVGRFQPFKRYEILIKAFAAIDSGRCIILGNALGSASGTSLRYITELRRLINSLGVQDRVKLFVNSPNNILSDVLSRASIYVHCALNEHFGISVVEAMASGCIPIVHKSGGAYTDIVKYGEYGFGFEDALDLSKRLNYLLNELKIRNALIKKVQKRAEDFNELAFKNKILKLVTE